jgi:hypothetical protein
VVEGDLLCELEGLDTWVFSLALTAPGSNHPGEWIEIFMEIFWDCECHYFVSFSGLKFLAIPRAPQMMKVIPQAKAAAIKSTLVTVTTPIAYLRSRSNKI